MPLRDQLERDYRAQEKKQLKLARQRTQCSICGERIVGKAFRVKEGKYACNRCNNERPNK